MKRFSLLTVMIISIALGSVLIAHQNVQAQCIETPNDTFNCNATDTDGVDTTGNGANDIVNLNGNTINNSGGGNWAINANNVIVNGGGNVNGFLAGINANGNITTNNVAVSGQINVAIHSNTGNVIVNGGSASGGSYGIFAGGNVITTNAVISGGTGISANGTVNVTGGTITASNGITSGGNITINNATISASNYGIITNGNVNVIGGSLTSDNIGIYTPTGEVVIDSAAVTGGAASVYFEANNDLLTLTNTTAIPTINGVMDGNDGYDTLVGQQRAKGSGAYVETVYTCANLAALCNGDPITYSRPNHSFSIDNFEQITILRWKPF